MICPHCGHDNLPGSEECRRCSQDLTHLDRPIPADRVERSLVGDTVSVLQPHAPITIHSQATVEEAIRLLLDRNIGALLVVEPPGKVMGMFTERDVLTKVAGLHDPAQIRVHQVMTRAEEVEVVEPGHSLAFALHKMDIGGYRHIPVVDESGPIGIISVRDMLHHITRLCKEG